MMEEDFAHDTCSMFVNGMYKYEAVIKMFEAHRQDVLKEAYRRLCRLCEYEDAVCKIDQWLIDARRDRMKEALFDKDLDQNL